MKFRTSESADTGGGNWLDKPGTYHLVVTSVDEEPKSKKGEMLDAFRVTMQALEGTVRDKDGFTERGKTVDIMFWSPKLTDKNEGEFSRKKQTRYLLSTGLITESQLGSDVEIDLEQSRGRHVIATLEERDGDGDKKFIDLHFADIFHIDDPAVAKFPKCQRSLGMIPKAHRRAPNSFKPSSGGGNGGGNSSGVDLDSL